MIVAGEVSGDLHAAKVVRELGTIDPSRQFRFLGCAGPKMREAGVEATVNADALSVVGLAEITRSLPVYLKAFKELRAAAIEYEPCVVVLVDFPEFNLKLARALKRLGFRVVYYISHQLWAWRKYRISAVRKHVDLMITILPFEKAWYAKNGFSAVEYVGSPLAREVTVNRSKPDFCKAYGLDPNRPLIALLPGSREREISRILPVLLQGAEEVRHNLSGCQFVIAAAGVRNDEIIRRIISLHESVNAGMTVVTDDAYDLLNAADAAAIASGTATLEAAIIGTPMVIAYKTSRLNYQLFEPMIDVPHYGLVNLIAGRRVAAELIQDEFTPAATAAELLKLLEPAVSTAMRQDLAEVKRMLGHGGASRRAAEAILSVIDR